MTTRLVARISAALASLVVASCGPDAPTTSPPSPTRVPTEASSLPTSTEAESDEVTVFLLRADTACDTVVPVARQVDGASDLAAAMEALVAGATQAEQADGLFSWFSTATAGKVNSTEIAGGVARVDFGDFSAIIPNASTSCGSAGLLAQLDNTAMQFPGVERAVYSFDGDVDAFYGWLQLDSPG